jgi:ribosome maturation factor RimP
VKENWLDEKLRPLCEKACAEQGKTLYDVVFVSGSKGKGRVLKVYIDGENGGVSLDDCADVSRTLGLLLDVEEAIPGGAYSLEVSSPGIERPLRTEQHFQSAIGKKVMVQTSEPMIEHNSHLESLGKRQKAKGELVALEDKKIELNVDNMSITIPLDIVSKARVVYEPETHGKKR